MIVFIAEATPALHRDSTRSRPTGSGFEPGVGKSCILEAYFRLVSKSDPKAFPKSQVPPDQRCNLGFALKRSICLSPQGTMMAGGCLAISGATPALFLLSVPGWLSCLFYT